MSNTKPKPAAAQGAPGAPKLRLIPIANIDEPALPAREAMSERGMAELVDSMQEIGLLSPLIVFEKGGRVEVVAGHRRLLAARELGWAGVPCIVHPSSFAAKDAAMLHENVVRENLNAAEEAVFIAQVMERSNLDEEGICRLMHKSPDYIADRLRLLRNDIEVFQALRRGDINLAVARELNKFSDEQMRRYYLDAAVRSGCSSRVVTQWLAEFRSQSSAPAALEGEAPAPVEQEPALAHIDQCFLCGGAKDPYNLVTVRIHRWELEELQKHLAAAGASES